MVATLQVDDRITNMLTAMHQAGMTRDQAEVFTRAGYIPLDGMLPFHVAARSADKPNGPEWIALGGKRGPGKTHTVMTQVGIDDCQRVPELKVLFLRKIMKSARESLDDIVRSVFRYTTHTPTADGLKLPNGSRIIIGGFKDERDIDKYLGIEYDVIVLEECTQISENKKNAIRGSLRTSKHGWRPRIYLTTNADGIGLAWFKKMFIEPWRKGMQTLTWFLDVTGIRNPFINPEYQNWLDTLTGNLRKAWKDGDWDAFAGMAFTEWNYERHVVRSFEIPSHWVKWRATDWGLAAPFCTLWFTKDPDTRRIFVYREAYQAGLTDQQQARMINDMTGEAEKIFIHYADPSLWERKNRHGEVFSTADEYKDEGITLKPGDNDRLSGKRKVSNQLADLADGEPGLQIFDTCVHLIEQMGSLASDKNNPEDVDTNQEDHAYDTLRYGLTNEKKIEREQGRQDSKPKPNPYRRIQGL
jgi:phage terminase large subunit